MKERYVFKRVINEGNLVALNQALANVDWLGVYQCNNANSAYDYFVKKYTEMFNLCCPLKKQKNKVQETNKPWFTNGLANACKKKNKLYRDYLKSRNKRKLLRYKQYKNKLTNILRCEEKRFYHRLLLKHKNNTKETQKVLKSIIDKKSNCSNFPDKCMDDGHEIIGLKDIATGFNNFFTNIGPNLAKKIEPPDKSLNIYDSMLNKNVNSMFLLCITEKELTNIVRSCKNKASSDCNKTVC